MDPSPKQDLAKQNIYLVGLMGTGKTTVGQLLACRLEMKFMDSDRVIEDSAQLSVSEIFSQYGENYFRRLERKFVEKGHPGFNCVVACGGGLCVPAGMMETLKSKGKVICLWASVDKLVKRTKSDKSRPLLMNGKPLEILENLMSERESRYRESDYIIETDGLKPDQVVLEILDRLNG